MSRRYEGRWGRSCGRWHAWHRRSTPRPEARVIPGRRGRKLKLPPARRSSLKLQGHYIGYLRNLKPRQKAQVKAVRSARGLPAAISIARSLARGLAPDAGSNPAFDTRPILSPAHLGKGLTTSSPQTVACAVRPRTTRARGTDTRVLREPRETPHGPPPRVWSPTQGDSSRVSVLATSERRLLERQCRSEHAKNHFSCIGLTAHVNCSSTIHTVAGLTFPSKRKS
jgi:hypothetical protein